MNIYDSVIAGATNGKYNSISSYFTGQNNVNFEKSLDTFKDLLNKAEKKAPQAQSAMLSKKQKRVLAKL